MIQINTDIPLISKKDFLQLAEFRESSCISILIPQKLKSDDRLFAKIYTKILRLKSDFKNELNSKRVSNSQFERNIRLVETRIEEWSKSSDSHSIGFFLTKNALSIFEIPLEIPFKVYYNDHFYLKSICPLFNSNSHLIILFLNKANARIFQANATDLKQITGVQNRSANNRNSEFYSRIETVVDRIITASSYPLVIAGTKKRIKDFKESCVNVKFNHEIELNSQTFKYRILSKKAAKIILKIQRNNVNKTANLIKRSTDKDLVLTDLNKIMNHAAGGKVKMLFLEKENDVIGEYDEANDFVFQISNDHRAASLSNLAAVKTIVNNGNVFLLEHTNMPLPKERINAILQA